MRRRAVAPAAQRHVRRPRPARPHANGAGRRRLDVHRGRRCAGAVMAHAAPGRRRPLEPGRVFIGTAIATAAAVVKGTATATWAATALALLPFLGAGQTHTRGMYQVTVRAGLAWLLVQQERRSATCAAQASGRMYAHGIATIVLCEAYALTGDETLQRPGATGDQLDRSRAAPQQRPQRAAAGDTSPVSRATPASSAGSSWRCAAGRMGGLQRADRTFRAGRQVSRPCAARATTAGCTRTSAAAQPDQR